MRNESWKRENRHSSSKRHSQDLQSNDRRILTMKSATQRFRSAISKNDVKAETVRVAVRCRPQLKKEIADDHQRVVQVNCKLGTIQLEKPAIQPSNGSINGSMTNSALSISKLTNSSYNSYTNNSTNNEDDNMKIYTFDSVYDENSTQEEIYADIFHPLVDSVLKGFNGTIFAYGQTGTGKTFTMEGTAEHPGVIPRSFTHIFSHIARSTDKQFLVRVSYLEIYQENIRDLLSSDIDQKLVLREKPDNGVYVEDLSSFVCKNVEEIEKRLIKGRQNRAVGSTNMNEHSSRSHAIFMITIEHSSIDSSGHEHIKVGKLNLVDLAGSERLTKTKSSGIRQKEGITINLSLSALSNVISALVDGRSKHIPYRDSKLTRLLQDSLGGNARTVMVANIGPSSYNYEETLTTLRYANRAKNIKNKPRVNQDPKDALLREFQDEIERLRQQLELRRKAKNRPDSNLDSLAHKNNEAIDFEAVEKIQNRINAMESKMLVGGKNIVDHTNEQQRELESRMELLRQQRQREREMLRQLNEQEEATQEVRETFTSLQQEVELKRRKLRKVVKEFQSVNSEIRDLHDNNSEERLELDRISSDLMRELKFRYLIIDNFIPEQEKTRFLRKIYYDENDEEWHYRPTSSSGSDSQTGPESEMESSTYSRPGTAISRPSSVYIPNSERQNSHNQSSIYSSFYDINNSGKHSRFLLGFKVPFYTERVDQLGLYLPERTTMDYDSYIAQNGEQDEDDDLQIDIIDINDDKQTAISSKWIRNEKMIGKTPPPMRRSLTMMNHYSNDQTQSIVDLWESIDAADSSTPPSSQSTSNLVHIGSPNASTMLDLKRANVRRKLCQSASQRNIENLNVRPDTAFPRSRGLVPK